MRLEKPKTPPPLSKAKLYSMEAFRWTVTKLNLKMDNRKADEIKRFTSTEYYYEDSTHRVDTTLLKNDKVLVEFENRRTKEQVTTIVDMKTLRVTLI
jgi:hypothetical protein